MRNAYKFYTQTSIIGHRYIFFRQIIPESSCIWKETGGKLISKIGDRIIIQTTTTSRWATTMRNRRQFNKFRSVF